MHRKNLRPHRILNTHPDIRPADRLSLVKEYWFAAKLREIARLNAEGHDIVSLGTGGPDLPPAPEVIDALCDDARRPDTHSYQNSRGLPKLRQAFADWYAAYYGVTLDPQKEILPLIGSKESVIHISLAFLNPGDKVLVPNPGYPTYTSASRIAGAQVVYYDLLESAGYYPDFKALEKMPLDGVKLMWVNYPHMPTGTPADPEVMCRIVDFGRRHGIVIVNDNPYSFILHEKQRSILAIEGAKEIAIELNSLSKSHNMAGWRVAMAASNPTFIEWIAKVKSNVDSGQPHAVMTAAAKALSLGPDWYAALNERYAERRVIAEKIMEALGCVYDPRQRGLFLWGRIPEGETSAENFAQRILKEKRVFVVPGFIFGSNGERYIRISLCATPERLQEALSRMS